MKEIVIPKDKAAFWMDGRGRWHNRFGPFAHKKIIDYFNSCIRKDAHGFFLEQELEGKKEKVYFPCEDTAFFVTEIAQDAKDVFLILNTKARLTLHPEQLFIAGDFLYMRRGEDRIKFVESGLMQISKLLVFEKDQYWIRIGSQKFQIPVESTSGEHSGNHS